MHATRPKAFAGTILGLSLLLGGLQWHPGPLEGKPNRRGPFNIAVPKVSTDPTIKYDYDIVYIRTPRKGNAPHSSPWPDASLPLNVDAGGDLMLLHPDGSEERLVAGGKGYRERPPGKPHPHRAHVCRENFVAHHRAVMAAARLRRRGLAGRFIENEGVGT
jgi:hypothetical protein